MIRRYTAAAIAMGVLLVTGCSASGQSGQQPSAGGQGEPATDTETVTAASTATVSDFYELAFTEKNYTEAAERYLAEDYIQHSPNVADGRAGFVDGMGAWLDGNPEATFTVARVVAEGDLVLVHANVAEKSGERGSAVMDIFRVADGAIAEHWDAVQEVPEESANGHSMFDGETTTPERDLATRDKNREATLDFLDLAFNRADAATAVERHVAEEYTQHNPFVADGGAAFVEAFAGATPLTGDAATRFPRTIAQGDFVAVQTFAPSGQGMAGSGSIDIFRFDESNKIVEHWDAVQDYPEKTASGNTVWDDGR